MRPRYLFTISAEHVRGAGAVRPQIRQAEQALGILQACDIGKRVFLAGDVVQVENDQQRADRLASPRSRLSIAVR